MAPVTPAQRPCPKSSASWKPTTFTGRPANWAKSMKAGGTVAQFIAGMNIDVVDLGVPVMSMHAPMEIVSKMDVYEAYNAFVAFYK